MSDLVRVSDAGPGLRRRRRGRSFSYVDDAGRPVRDPEALRRIRSLGIPPAWTDVWICPDPNGHIQAVGRDARGRKQYRYHTRWREARDDDKFRRMVSFGNALGRIRERALRDLSRPGLPRERVLAGVVRLLERTQIRVGNEEYARANRSFGLTTLRRQHAEVRGSRLRFVFRGKGGKQHEVTLQDARLARLVRRCQEVPGPKLFEWVDGGGRRRAVASEDVNAWLRESSGSEFTAKDFRTWAATVRAAWELMAAGPKPNAREARRTVKTAIENAARRLGNTPTICRKSYIHPGVPAAYLDGSLHDALRRARRHRRRPGLSAPEATVLAFLERLARSNGPGRSLEATLRASIAAASAKVPLRGVTSTPRRGRDVTNRC